MPKEPIFVDNKPFYGRVERQKHFRAALKEVLADPQGEELPYIVLLYGDGGIGKSTLAKRFREIAQFEQPFDGEFSLLWVDWEEEQNRYPSLKVGRKFIRPETVFEVLHAAAVKNGWGNHFKDYQEVINNRAEIEKKVLEALTPVGDKDDFGELRSAGAAAIAKLLRFGLPIIGDAGEALAREFLEAGIKTGAESAALLGAKLEQRIRSKLGSQYELFLNPNDQLARAFGRGLKNLSARKPLLLVLDTYEIVDRADFWLRTVMRTAGPRVVWILSGRNDLYKSRLFEDSDFKGYSDDFPQRVLAFDVEQLAEQDIRQLFTDRVPERPLDDAAVEAIKRATFAIPLALDIAAELWSKNIPLAEIVGDASEVVVRKEIVHRMTARYLLHAIQSEADKKALYALALADGDVEILHAMLRPDAEANRFRLVDLVIRLSRDYASVHLDENKLHEEPAIFIRNLLKEENLRSSDEIKDLNQCAVSVVKSRCLRMERDLPRIEDRCTDDDWVKAALDLTKYKFWLDESDAWYWLVPRYLEAVAYSKEFRLGLVEIAAGWKQHLSMGGKKRHKIFMDMDFDKVDELSALVDELNRVGKLGWFKGAGEEERKVILTWLHGKVLDEKGMANAAFEQYEQAARTIPVNCERLRKRLAESLENFVIKWTLEKSIENKTGLDSGLKALQLAHELVPNNPNPLALSGLTYLMKLEFEAAIAAFQTACHLDPKFAYPHHGLGNVYRGLKQYEAAIAAYQTASQLDPKFAYPHNGLGNVYADLEQYDAAIAAYQTAIQLDPKLPYPHNNLADVFICQGKIDEARRELNERIRLAPENSFSPLVKMGVLARAKGLPESNEFFDHALEQWESAQKAGWNSKAKLLEFKAIAMLCQGRKVDAIELLAQAIAEMGKADDIEFDLYNLLSNAPIPPEGIEEMITLLKEAEENRKQP